MYYTLFHSLINCIIIAWGEAYNNVINLLQEIQKRLFKIINKNKFIGTNYPLNIQQLFILEELMLSYVKPKTIYIKSKSKTRNKNILLSKRKKIYLI